MIKKHTISARLLSIGFTVGLFIIITGICISSTEHNNATDSPFGFTPAAVIPPFKYGLNNPYTFAEDLGVQWDRSLNFVWARIQPDLTRNQYYWMNERQLLDVPKQIRLTANIIIGRL
ncbi:MAG: hypothetical protein D3909_06835, partial [Candidatus Electrothrix sp. ATG1]|nr:hypothetical protein [Candidatus Electrothrix sp. ATG1]